MPGIEAGKVGVSDIAGTPTDPETIVLPYVTVLPMGGVGLFTFVSPYLSMPSLVLVSHQSNSSGTSGMQL